MDELVRRLCESEHEVTAGRVGTQEELRKSVGRRYVLLEFAGTRGGTELGVELDEVSADLAVKTLEQGAEPLRLTGGLRLNYTDVRCVAVLDPRTLKGTARLEVAESA